MSGQAVVTVPNKPDDWTTFGFRKLGEITSPYRYVPEQEFWSFVEMWPSPLYINLDGRSSPFVTSYTDFQLGEFPENVIGSYELSDDKTKRINFRIHREIEEHIAKHTMSSLEAMIAVADEANAARDAQWSEVRDRESLENLATLDAIEIVVAIAGYSRPINSKEEMLNWNLKMYHNDLGFRSKVEMVRRSLCEYAMQAYRSDWAQ